MPASHEYEIEVCRVTREVSKIKMFGSTQDEAIKKAIIAGRSGSEIFLPAGNDVFCRYCSAAPNANLITGRYD